VHQLDQPILATHLEQVLVQFEAAIVRLVFLPDQEILLLCLNGPVTQSLGVIPGNDELHGTEEPFVKLGPLVGAVLADTVANRHGAAFQFQHRHGNAMHVQHKIRPPLAITAQGNFLGNGEVVLLRLLPVDHVDGFRNRARFALHRHAVAQQLVDFFVIAIEATAVVIRLSAQFVEDAANLFRGIAVPGQVGSEQPFLNVAVTVAVGPVAEVAVTQLIAEERNDTPLRGAFGLADVTHNRLSLLPNDRPAPGRYDEFFLRL
jgi:hypothetical protein